MSGKSPAKHGPLSARVWQLAWPTIVSNLLLTSVQFAHIKVASGLGTSAVAAITTGHRVYFLVQAMMMGLSVASTALVSRYWGAGSRGEAESANWSAMALCLALSACTTLPLILFPAAVAEVFGLDSDTTTKSAQFIFYYGLFMVFVSINLMLSTGLRATGDVITPLWFLTASVILNVILSYLFAYGAFGHRGFGVAGIAIGGGLATTLPALVFIAVWWRGKLTLGAKKTWRLDRSHLRQLVRIGTPSILEQGFIQIAMLGFFLFLGQYGTAAYAAYGIGISIVSFSLVVAFGFGLAAATLVGQQLGAGAPEAAFAAGWRALRMAIGAMCMLSLLLALFATNLAGFMISDELTRDLTASFVYLIAASQPIMAIEITLGGALRGAGDTRYPLVATILGMVFGRILPAILFVAMDFSVYWMFATTLFDYAIKAVLLIARYRSGKWLHTKIYS